MPPSNAASSTHSGFSPTDPFTQVAADALVPEAPTMTFVPPADANQQTATGGQAEIETDLDLAQHLPQIPGYQLLKVIGRGGMGTVYHAIQSTLQREVALKLISAPWASDTAYRTRFLREVTTLAAFDHENIVPVYDAGTWQGLLYLTMKFVGGKTLHHHLEALRNDLRTAVPILTQVARAVHHLHEKGLVHRDLKPLNILLTPEGKPLVADFGLVRPLDDDSDLSLTLVPLGTRQYMAPEQTRGGKANYTPACDIWALGIILYELVAGRRPFMDDDTFELFRQIRYAPLPAIPAEKNAPAELVAITEKCLQKEPKNRYATAAELADDLERWLAGQQPLARSQPTSAKPVHFHSEEFHLEQCETTQTIPQRHHPPQRRLRWRGLVSLVVVANAVLIGAAAVWQPWGKPDESPVTTLAERLARGEKITLIAEKGLSQVPAIPLPGCSGTLTESRDGYATLTAAGATLIELWKHSTAQPLRLRAEYAITEAQDLFSTAGVYVAGKTESTGEQLWQSAVIFGHRNEYFKDQQEKAKIRERFGFTLYTWHNTPPGINFRLPQTTRIIDAPGIRDPNTLWRTVEVVIRPEVLEATYEGLAVPPLLAHHDPNQPQLLSIEMGVAGVGAGPGQSVFQPPYIGPSIGVFVNNANAIFRNVSLELMEK
ncbi:MAG: serine/threonine-protein kinase [Gemmataceae bacterium]|nr:serine/threonine-protein kinase [Gemmataceae bacterium]